MKDALGANQPAKGEGANDQLADRYAIGAQLGQNERVQTFRATDRWLDRPVVMVVETGSGGGTLAETCQALAGDPSPNLVEIYDRGEGATYPFVVCELPMSTVASLVQEPDQSLWNEGWAIDTAEQLTVALADLNRTGVDTNGLHFGYIGIDRNGRVRLSPWPLAEHPDGSPAPASTQELVASVLESGVRASGSSGSSKVAEVGASLHQTSAGDVPLDLDVPLGVLSAFGASVDDGPKGAVPLELDLPLGVLAGFGASVDDGPKGTVPLDLDPPLGVLAAFGASVYDEPTEEVPVTTGAVLLSQDAPSPVDRRRHRVQWPVAAGVCLTGLVAFLGFKLVSSNPPAPANASTNAAGACAGRTTPCPTRAVSKSPSSTIAGLQLPITPVSATTTTTVPPSTTTTTTTPASGAGGGAVPPVGTAPTTTTAAPSTTTTTVPPSTTTTTTTTVPPSTTTTTTAP